MVIILLFDVGFSQHVSFILLLRCSDLFQALVNTSSQQPLFPFLGYARASFFILYFPLCWFYRLLENSRFIKLVWISLWIDCCFEVISFQIACGQHHCVIFIRLWNFKKQIVLHTVLLVLKLVQFPSQQLVQQYLLFFCRHARYIFFFGLILNGQVLFGDRFYCHQGVTTSIIWLWEVNLPGRSIVVDKWRRHPE